MNVLLENKYIRVRVSLEFWETYKEKALEYKKKHLRDIPVEELQSTLILNEAMRQMDGPCSKKWNIEVKATFEGAKERVFATGTIPDGFNGHRDRVGFFILNNRIMILTTSGYFKSHFPECRDENEAKKMIGDDAINNGYVQEFTLKK